MSTTYRTLKFALMHVTGFQINNFTKWRVISRLMTHIYPNAPEACILAEGYGGETKWFTYDEFAEAQANYSLSLYQEIQVVVQPFHGWTEDEVKPHV